MSTAEASAGRALSFVDAIREGTEQEPEKRPVVVGGRAGCTGAPDTGVRQLV